MRTAMQSVQEAFAYPWANALTQTDDDPNDWPPVALKRKMAACQGAACQGTVPGTIRRNHVAGV